MIEKVVITRDRDALHIVGQRDIDKFRLWVFTDIHNRIDVNEHPVSRDEYDLGTYLYGELDELIGFRYRLDKPVGRSRSWRVDASILHRVTGKWTIPVSVQSVKRHNILMFMDVSNASKYIPSEYKLIFIPADISYDGEGWAIIREEDYTNIKDILGTELLVLNP